MQKAAGQSSGSRGGLDPFAPQSLQEGANFAHGHEHYWANQVVPQGILVAHATPKAAPSMLAIPLAGVPSVMRRPVEGRLYKQWQRAHHPTEELVECVLLDNVEVESGGNPRGHSQWG